MAGLGRKVWTNETLSAPDLQGYLQDQVVQEFDSAAARAAAIPAPWEGVVSYLRDVNRWEGYTAHPTTGALGWRPLGSVPPQDVTFDTSKANHYAAVPAGAASGIQRVRVWAEGRTVFSSGLMILTAAIGGTVEQTVGTIPTGLAPMGREIFLGASGPASSQRFDVYPAGGATDRAIRVVTPAAGLAVNLTVSMAGHWSLD